VVPSSPFVEPNIPTQPLLVLTVEYLSSLGAVLVGVMANPMYINFLSLFLITEAVVIG